MTFAETIKRTRQRLFFSQEAFAKELSVNLTTVSRWETGRSKPNISTMRQIKEFCEMHNVDYEPIESSWLTESWLMKLKTVTFLNIVTWIKQWSSLRIP